jgi:hypothetical protein
MTAGLFFLSFRAVLSRLELAGPGQTFLMVWDSNHSHQGTEPTVSVMPM